MNLVEYGFSSDEENEHVVKLKKEESLKKEEQNKKDSPSTQYSRDGNKEKEKKIEKVDKTTNNTKIDKTEIVVKLKNHETNERKEVNSSYLNPAPSKEEESKETTHPKDYFINNDFKDVEITESNFEEVFHIKEDSVYVETLQKKIDELTLLYESGMTINKNIEKSRDYKNPGIAERIMNIFDIYKFSTNYSKEVYNPEELECLNLFTTMKNTEIERKQKTKWSDEQ